MLGLVPIFLTYQLGSDIIIMIIIIIGSFLILIFHNLGFVYN